MSKKFKFFVGALVIAAVAVISAPQANAAFMYTGVLKQGSTGESVRALQQTLNMTNCPVSLSGTGSAGYESTYFGAKTKAAVVCFQLANPSVGAADGIVGSHTGAALAAVVPGTSGSTTGALCPNGMTLASNCTTAPGATTGALCPNGMTLASNCTVAPGSTGSVSTGGPLSINNVSAISGYLNTTVGVAEQDKPVADVRLITGAGGSGSLTGVNVSFYNAYSGSGEYQFTKFAQNASVWLNGVKVGSLDASQFAQYNSVYSAFIPTTGATLNANSTNDIKIAVTALPVIDSASMSNDNWLVDLTSIRYSDSTGAFSYTPSNVFGNQTSGGLSGTAVPSGSTTYFSFASAASAQSIKLTVTKNINDANDRVITGSSSTTTQGQQLAMIDLNAQGSAINIRRLPVTLVVGGNATMANAVLNTVRLYDGSGNLLDSESVPTGSTYCSTDSNQNTCTITFQNLNLTVAQNSTTTLTVKGDFNTVNGTSFSGGDYAEVDVTSTNVSNTQAYDAGNNSLSSSYLTGSTTGSKVYVYVNGVNVTTVAGMSPSISVAAAGGSQSHSTVTYTIPFAVTSFGSIAYIPSTAAAATSASATNKVQFCVDATTACAAAGTGVISYLGSDNLQASANGTYQIPIGQTKNFQLVITYQPASAISTRAKLLNVNWSASDATSGGTWYTYTAGLPSNSFTTGYAAAQ